MPIKLPPGLPACDSLRKEGVVVAEGPWSGPHGGRPLRVALLNLMPQKSVTETQIARLLGRSPHRVALTLLVPGTYRSKTAPPEHMAAFYRPWPAVRERDFDGLIVTGAPVETLPFEAVAYWDELTAIFDWAQTRVRRSFHICWAAQAALYHAHGVPKHGLEKKMFGIFAQQAGTPGAALLKGLEGGFPTPVSRHTEVRVADLPRDRGLDVLASSPAAGLCLVEDRPRRAVYMFNPLEYDRDTLAREYRRDRDAGLETAVPENYFPDDDPARPPTDGWCRAAQRLFDNWLDRIVADARRCGAQEKEMAWLLAEPRNPLRPHRVFTDILVTGGGKDDLLPCVLRALAEQDLSPLAVKVHRRDPAKRDIELRLDGLGSDRAQRLAQQLLRLRHVERVTYRGANGTGGTFAEGETEPPAARDRRTERGFRRPKNPEAA